MRLGIWLIRMSMGVGDSWVRCAEAHWLTPPPSHAGYLDISVEDAGPHQVQDSAHAHAQT